METEHIIALATLALAMCGSVAGAAWLVATQISSSSARVHGRIDEVNSTLIKENKASRERIDEVEKNLVHRIDCGDRDLDRRVTKVEHDLNGHIQTHQDRNDT